MWYHCSYRYPVPLQCQLSCYTAVIFLCYCISAWSQRLVEMFPDDECSAVFRMTLQYRSWDAMRLSCGQWTVITLHGMLFQARKFSYLPDVSLKSRDVSVPCPGKRQLQIIDKIMTIDKKIMTTAITCQWVKCASDNNTYYSSLTVREQDHWYSSLKIGEMFQSHVPRKAC